jgi:hypothetical protein
MKNVTGPDPRLVFVHLADGFYYRLDSRGQVMFASVLTNDSPPPGVPDEARR